MELFKIEELEQVSPLFRGKAGHGLARGIFKALGVSRIQEGYDRNDCYEGPEFASHILEEFGVRYSVEGPGLGLLPEGPFITVSNHPYGSIDGLALVDIFGHLRPDFKIMVNKVLGRVKALEPSFIKVTPTLADRKAPDQQTMSGIREALRHVRDGHPLGLVPAGAVSDLSLKDRCIRDREWQEPILRFIRKVELPVVPVRFFDRNSDFYYLLGLIDWRIRVLRLPREVLNKTGRQVRVGIGAPISPEAQAACSTLEDFGALLRDSVYSMKPATSKP